MGRHALKILVRRRVAHEPPQKLCRVRRNAGFRKSRFLPQHCPPVFRHATHQPHSRQGTVSGNGTGHTGDLQGCCRENALSERKVRLLRRQFQLLQCRQCPAGADHVGGQHRFRPEAQSLCRFQQFLSGKRLPQCDKIGIAGIPHGICQILQSVPLRVVAAEPLGANGNRPVAVPLKRRFRTVFIGTGCRHQLENRPHRIGVQGTLDHGAVRILHGFSQCIGRVAGKAGKPQNVPAFHVHDYHTALLQ